MAFLFGDEIPKFPTKLNKVVFTISAFVRLNSYFFTHTSGTVRIRWTSKKDKIIHERFWKVLMCDSK